MRISLDVTHLCYNNFKNSETLVSGLYEAVAHKFGRILPNSRKAALHQFQIFLTFLTCPFISSKKKSENNDKYEKTGTLLDSLIDFTIAETALVSVILATIWDTIGTTPYLLDLAIEKGVLKKKKNRKRNRNRISKNNKLNDKNKIKT